MAADGTIRIDVDLNSNAANRNLNELRNNADNVGKTEGGFSKVTGAIGSIAKASVIAVGAVAGLAGAAGALALPFVRAAADAQAATAQFDQVFGDLRGQATSALNDIAQQTNILPNRLQGAYTSIAAFAKTTGASTADALDLTSRATLAAADSAAFYDRSIESVTESLQSYLKGNFENDAALGISSTETTRNTKANELFGKSFKDLDESQKQLTLLAQVEDGNKLAGAFGQAAREGSAFENVTGNLKQAFTDFKATVGGYILQPFIDGILLATKALQSFDIKGFVEKLKGVYDSFVTFIQPLTDFLINFFTVTSQLWSEYGSSIVALATEAFSNIYNVISTTIGGVLEVISTILTELYEFIQNNGREILQNVTDTFNSIYDFVRPLIEEVVDFIQTRLQFLADFWEANGQQIFEAVSNAFNLILDIIQFVMPAIELIIRVVWEAIQNIIDGALNVITGLVQIFAGIFTLDIKLLWEGVKDLFVGAIELIIGFMTLSFVGGIRTLLTNLGKTALGLIKNMWSTITNSFSASIGTLVGLVGGLVTGIVGFFKNIFDAGIDTFSRLATDSINYVKDLAKGVLDAIKDLPGDFYDIGVAMITGLIDGLKKLNPIPYIKDIAGSIKGTLTSAFSINSPSKYIRDDIVGSLAEGGVKGVIKYKDEFASVGTGLADEIKTGITGLQPNFVDLAFDGNRPSNNSNVSNNNSKTATYQINNTFTEKESNPYETTREQEQMLRRLALQF